MLRGTTAALHLDLCSPFEMIVVTTRRSVYELIVLHGDIGDVLVRGGDKFPEFRRARFVGSTAGGSMLKLRTIGVGLQMEFHLGPRNFVTTSSVKSVTRHTFAPDEVECTVA
jgi:hypothetical protein